MLYQCLCLYPSVYVYLCIIRFACLRFTYLSVFVGLYVFKKRRELLVTEQRLALIEALP